MRWKALFYLKGDNAESTSNKYGFRSKACPPQIEEMKPFEEDLYSMMENLSFRRSSNKLQDTMRKDMKLIRECGEVIVSSDKTRNLYRMPVDQYKKLLRDNVTSKYIIYYYYFIFKDSPKARWLIEGVSIGGNIYRMQRQKKIYIRMWMKKYRAEAEK